MTSSNKHAFIALVAAIILLVGIVVLAGKKGIAPAPVAENPSEEQSGELCYFSSTPTASGYNDTYYLKLALDGTTATGELATIPAEKDAMKGILVGNIIENNGDTYFSGTYSNSAEGMTNIDERMIKLSDTEAAIGYGEMVQNADGSYGYKDANNLNYSLTIPRVDCAAYDDLKTEARA